MSENDTSDQISLNTEIKITRTVVEFEKMEELLLYMSNDPNLLKQGYKLISEYEKNRNFYLNFMKVIFNSEHNTKVKKLAASTLKIFLNKNWSDENYITPEERMVKL